MKTYNLNYYPKFKCIQGECKHTCCAGWKMCIDEKTLADYKNDSTPFGKTLRQGVDFKRGQFKWSNEKRCPFLNKDGLCDIIINLGEKSLCQVCRDHPRFRSFFTDRVETGLGFCCEEATKIILSQTEKIQLDLVSDDKETVQPDFVEKVILDFRNKIINVLQDRNITVAERIKSVIKECKPSFTPTLKQTVKIFLSFERLDNEWGKGLKMLKTQNNFDFDEEYSICYEQFLVNTAFRHISRAEDIIDAKVKALSCVICAYIVSASFNLKKQSSGGADFSDLAEIVRSFSSEVEYSEKNLNKLSAFARKIIRV